MKSTDTTFWNSFNAGATNKTGFNGLPGGARFDYGTFVFEGLGEGVVCWSSMDHSYSGAWFLIMTTHENGVRGETDSKANGLSVRCLRD